MTLNTFAGFDALPPSYTELFRCAANGSFFLGRPWFETLARTTLEADQEVRIYGLETTSGPCAVLVGRCSRSTARPRIFHSLSNFYTMEFAPLIASDTRDIGTTLVRLMAGIAADQPRWDILKLDALVGDGPVSSFNLAAALRAAGWIVRSLPHTANWYEPCENQTYEQYRKRLPSGVRRLDRKFDEADNIRFELVADSASLAQKIHDYERVYEKSWKTAENYPDFIPQMIRCAAESGNLRLGLLYVDDVPAAAQLWLRSGNGTTIYKIAYDETYKKVGVGSMLMLRMLRHMIDVERVREVDYGTGDDQYKQDWMSCRRERQTVIAYNRATMWGRLVAAKALGKDHLSDLVARARARKGA